jgi:hypothetical protein
LFNDTLTRYTVPLVLGLGSLHTCLPFDPDTGLGSRTRAARPHAPPSLSSFGYTELDKQVVRTDVQERDSTSSGAGKIHDVNGIAQLPERRS